MKTPNAYVLSRLFLLWLGLVLSSSAAAQFTLPMGEQLTLTPTSATPAGKISVAGARLADGDYRVELVDAARSRHLLVSIAGGTGEFQRTASVPSLPSGNYIVELLVAGRLVDSVSLRVLPPLGVTPSSTSPRAGSKLAFTVSGLAEGALTLLYAGKPAFGPVNVSSGSFSGTLIVPTDRPATLPASVALTAHNMVGKLVPRVGSRNLSVQTADTRPFLRVSSSTTSNSTPTARERFRIGGSVASNEAEPLQAQVHHYWVGSNGKVVPMGALGSQLQADGSFSHELATPQIGTGSAWQANGAGHVMSVTQWRDERGVLQSESTRGPDLTTTLDTDAAIDISLTLTGTDGTRIEGARIVMSNADLDELYPPNSNEAGVYLSGANAAQFPLSQFEREPLYLAGSCPPNESRQYTDANGRAQFEFGLDVPQGGTGFGNAATPLLTIQPETLCNDLDINTHICTHSDPAGITLQLSVLALHTGYGYATEQIVNGLPTLNENVVKIYARIDRYIGAIQTDLCLPGQTREAGTCRHQEFSRSANISLTLPKAPKPGLILGVPYFPAAGGESGITIASAQWGTVARYAPIADLSAFTSAAFSPTQPPARSVFVQYLRGAAPAMATGFPKLVVNDGRDTHVLTMTSQGGSDCENTEGGAVTYSVALPTRFNEGLRFPQRTFGNRDTVRVSVVGQDVEGRTGLSQADLVFVDAGATAAALAGRPNLAINTSNPHARKLTLAPTDVTARTDSAAPPAEFNVGAKTNQAVAQNDYELCLPSDSPCGAFTEINSSHLQFNKPGDSPPAGEFLSGSEDVDTRDAPWEVLFEKTIPLFRWYWGVPELLSAEVFADLKLKAEYLFRTYFASENPGSSLVQTGGRMGVGIFIGVDIDVLFGILVDAGAGITGTLTGEVVAEAGLSQAPCVKEDLTFRMDFSGWLEIGCPIPNPFDPTCYIPDIEENYNILNEQVLGGNTCVPVNKRAPLGKVGALLAGLPSGAGLAGGIGRPPAIDPITPEERRGANRHGAIAADGVGNRMSVYVSQLGNLVAAEQPPEGGRNLHQLSTAFGIRDVAVSYFSADRAVAVWAESDITSTTPNVSDLASRQYLRTATFNGTTWSDSVPLTSPGFGEGGTRLARCKPRVTALRSDCVAQRVSLVYQRNTQRRMGGHKHVYLRHFNGTSWSAEVRVDSSGDYNLTPAIAYQNAQPVVAWVRYDPGTVAGSPEDPTLPALSKVDARRLALRVMDGSAAEEVLSGLPTRVAQPTLAAIDDQTLAIAFTRAADSDAFVGLRQALHLGTRSCSVQPCRTTARMVRDARGRAIYGERPTLLVKPNGTVSIGFRALSLGVVNSAFPDSNLFADDPAGLREGLGAVVDLRANLATGRVALVGMGGGAGAVATQPNFAFDPASNELLAIQGQINPGDLFRKSAGDDGAPAVAKLQALEEGLVLASANDVPDLAIEAVEGSAARLLAGSDVPITVRVGNRGSQWQPDAEHVATLRLYWDTPETRGTLLAQIPIAALAPGGSATHVVQARVPAAFGVDERQSVRAEILVESPEGELDGSNNAGSVALGGMPVPQALATLSLPGSRLVNLSWTPIVDDRIAGFRVYLENDDGDTIPLGSSFNAGFTDLSARFGQVRRYRVASYSARGIESELSAPLSASPALEALTTAVFGSGFEGGAVP